MIKKTSQEMYQKACTKLDNLIKPPSSLGGLEEISAKIASIQNTLTPNIQKRCVLVMSSDNGVFEEGVASAPQSVTASQTINMLNGLTGVGVLIRAYNTDLFVVDLGVNADINHPRLIKRKISYSTKNFCKEPAMTIEQFEKAFEVGEEITTKIAKEDYKVIGIGEMGICNTSTTTAVLCALMGLDDCSSFVGRGGGLSDQGFVKKVQVINNALKLHKLDKNNTKEILQKVGGYDIAAMTSAFLAGAKNGVAMAIDGYISAVAALAAYRIDPNVKDYLFASHISMEKGYTVAINEIGLKPCLALDMRLGEGSGCPVLFSVMDGALFMFNNMASFGETDLGEDYLEVLGDIKF